MSTKAGAIHLAVWEDLAVSNRDLQADTDAHYLLSLKVVALEQDMLADVANMLQWSAMSSLLRENSGRMIMMIQGKGKHGQKFRSEIAAWSRRYDALLHVSRDRWPMAGSGERSQLVAGLRKELKTYIAVTARVSISKQGRTSTSPPK